MKLPKPIAGFVARQGAQLAKHSPGIMFSVGIAGAVTATVLACRSTLRLEETLVKHEEDRKDADYNLNEKSLSTKEHAAMVRHIQLAVVRDVAKLYAPAVGVGVVSVGLLTGAHVTLNRRNAALIAAYNVLDKGFKQYRERVRQELGEDKDREFMFGSVDKEIVEEGEHGHEVKTVKRHAGPSAYARKFEEGNPCWSASPHNNEHFLKGIQNYANDMLRIRGHVLLNDVYDMLKMERSEAGTVVGWVKGHGDNYVDFGIFMNKTEGEIRQFMIAQHNDGILLDFNVDGIVNDLIGRKY